MATPALRPQQIQSTVNLRTVRGQAIRSRDVRIADAAVGVPLLHAIPAAASADGIYRESQRQDRTLFGIWFACDLLSLPRRSRCVGVLLRVCFDDRRIAIRGLEPGAEQIGIRYESGSPLARTKLAEAALAAAETRAGWTGRMRSSDGRPRVFAEGLNGHAAGLFFGGTDAGSVVPDKYTVHVVVSVPADLPELTGTLRMDVSIAHGMLRKRVDHAHSRDPVPFIVSLPDRPASAGLAVAEVAVRNVTAPLAAVGMASVPGVRLCMAADIEHFSRFRTPESARAQQRFVDLLAAAREHAGIAASGVELQESGDGQFAVLPPALDETVVIPRLVEGLWHALAHTNADLSEHARLRVRAAFHRGNLRPGANGWVGESAIAVHRLLDSAPVREALAANPRTDFALIVPDTLYRDVIAQGYEGLPPDAFRRVTVELPEKSFAEIAHVYVPRP
jgi:hypothetical protein